MAQEVDVHPKSQRLLEAKPKTSSFLRRFREGLWSEFTPITP
jgi:hypothetical protein